MNADKEKNIQIEVLSLRSEIFTPLNLIIGGSELLTEMTNGEMDFKEEEKVDLKQIAEILTESSERLKSALENGVDGILELLDTDFDLDKYR